jgi:prophage maintenance system killer protein
MTLRCFIQQLSDPKPPLAGKICIRQFLIKPPLNQSLILNHPFDGNKRTAITSCARFLFINGWELDLPINKSIKFTLDIDSHKLSFEGIVNWLKKHSKKIK